MTLVQTISLVSIFAMIFMSAFFSGSETALTAASRSRIHQLERRGDRRARVAGDLLRSRERLIGTILLGNNAVNIFASALATSVLIGLVGEAGVFYATIAMTLIILIFAEILPKTYAIRNATRMALAVAPALKILIFALAPVVAAIQSVVSLTLYVFGIGIRPHVGRDEAEEELRGAISLHARAGRFFKQEHDMLHGILDLGEVTIGEIMIHRKNMVTINAGEPPSKIVEHVLSSPYTRFPLWRDDPDNIVGVLHAKDLLRAVYDARDDLSRIDIMAIAHKAWFSPESTTLRDQLLAFRQRHAHFTLVVDEYGALMGIATLEDVLEEIVGDISDEFDVGLHGIVPQPDGSYLIPGTTTIRDLNREFHWLLPDDKATTLAGFVIHEAQMIPVVGQEFHFYGFRFKVERRLRNQITQLRVTPPGIAGEEKS